MTKTDEKLVVNGKRIDGRKPDELRKIEMEIGVIPNANGSARVSFGKTTAIAAVYGPRPLFPRHLQESDSGIIQFKYDMATFSVDERKSQLLSYKAQDALKDRLITINVDLVINRNHSPQMDFVLLAPGKLLLLDDVHFLL